MLSGFLPVSFFFFFLVMPLDKVHQLSLVFLPKRSFTLILEYLKYQPFSFSVYVPLHPHMAGWTDELIALCIYPLALVETEWLCFPVRPITSLSRGHGNICYIKMLKKG